MPTQRHSSGAATAGRRSTQLVHYTSRLPSRHFAPCCSLLTLLPALARSLVSCIELKMDPVVLFGCAGAVAALPYTGKDVRASDCSSPAGLSIKQIVNASTSGPPEPVELLASPAAVLVSRSGRQTKAPGVFDPSEASRLPQWGSSLARQGSFLDGLSPPSSPAGSLTNTDQMGYL